MRGKPIRAPPLHHRHGITPARAGKTRSTFAPSSDPADHPRACGENILLANKFLVGGGSPPRVRGKRRLLHSARMPEGITPARAGKTFSGVLRISQTEDHPRACGENAAGSLRLSRQPGSPPRVRGKLLSISNSLLQIRITPARAGKTEVDVRGVLSDADHPRACGENAVTGARSTARFGSPPRVRGKPCRMPPMPVLRRITPARAGKTAVPPSRSPRPADHPRACGENRLFLIVEAESNGSPPRVRGKRSPARAARRGRRITPARAGKTSSDKEFIGKQEDHPRACGENNLLML